MTSETAESFLGPDGHKSAKTRSQTQGEKHGAQEKVRWSDELPPYNYLQFCSTK